MHGIEKMTHMDIFHHAMNYTSKGTVNSTFRGAFRGENAEETTQLIEELAKSNYTASSEDSGSSSRQKGGVIELNKISSIEANRDDFMNKMNTEDKIGYSYNEFELVEGVR